MAGFRVRLRKVYRQEALRLGYDIEKLQEPEAGEQFKATVGGKFAPLMLIDDIQEQTAEFTRQLNESALEVLGKRNDPASRG